IVAALEATGRFENALIVFTSDHGDHVGDHDRVGKGTFYEPSVHIPLVVRLPGAAGAGRRVATPVELQRVPATILAAGGADIPPWWNYPALPVPDITDSCGKTTDAERPVCGFLNTGTMIRIGPWKLSHYTAGFSELFNLDEDPTETINRINDPACDALLARLDSALRLWIQASIVTSHNDQRLPRKPALSASHAFGRRGWRQPYPAPLT
ncbi:MAG TPA: sulfatase-like hydrolase/transferase, partial [Rariglobus sp.]